MEEFFVILFADIEKKLCDRIWLTGDAMTFVDVMFYVEIYTVLKLYSKKIQSSDHPKLAKWYDTLSRDEIIMKYNAMFDEVCREWNLVDNTTITDVS